MESISYKNRKKEVNELIELILENHYKIILYNSEEGYGNTSFISRILYLLQSTKSLQIFSAELSPEDVSPLQIITKNIVCKDNELYQNLQMFTDDANGIYTVPLSLSTILKDLTKSGTIAALFSEKKATPIYTGFYQDKLKENFFQLISQIAENKRIVFFIDNIQFIDNNSVYELKSLLKKDNITFVIFKTGSGKYFEKFYYDIKYIFSCIEMTFPEPNIKYAQELAEIYDRTLSKSEADHLIVESQKNIRKLLYLIRKTTQYYILTDLEAQLLKIMFIYNDYISADDLLEICNLGPYQAIISKKIIIDSLIKLEINNYICCILSAQQIPRKIYKLTNHYIPQMDIADKAIIYKSLLHFYYVQEELDFKHLNKAYFIAKELNEQDKLLFFSTKIIEIALRMGYIINNDIIELLVQNNTYKSKLLSATYMFCNANYNDAKILLKELILEKTNRSLEIMFAISLNRCREHMEAENLLKKLIESSDNTDELAILVTFLISNYVHIGDLDKAQVTFENNNNKLKVSKNYPYFLRNSATIFESEKAYNLRVDAKNIFKRSNDMFGYYTTIINMSAYLIQKADKDYALQQLSMSFEGLQQYNAQQIHLAANNLGLYYLFNDNHLQSIKYFNLSIESAKTIMPITYASINLSGLYIKINEIEKAHECIYRLKCQVNKSNLPRLKTRYYYQVAVLYYIKGDFEAAAKMCALSKINSYSTVTEKYFSSLDFLSNEIVKRTKYTSEMWNKVFSPCYLEYWTVNSVDILDNNFLSL